MLSLGFFGCAWLGTVLSPPDGTAVSYWLPGGFFIAVLLNNPTRDWPWLLAAALPANIGFDLLHDAHPNPLLIAGFCLANIIQAGGGAWLVRRFVHVCPRLTSLSEFTGFILCAGVVGSAGGATIGSLLLTQLKLAPTFGAIWPVLWGGNFMAVLVLAPLILVWGDTGMRTQAARGWNFWRMTEAILVYGGMLGFLTLILAHGKGITSPKIPVLVFVMWSGLRFGLPGASIMVFLLAISTSYLTTHYQRGLTPEEIATSSYVFGLQIFVAISSMVALVPTIVLAERNRALADLRQSEARFRNLTNAAFEAIVISEGGRILDVNDQCARLFGSRREDLIGRNLIDYVAPSSRAIAAAAIQERREMRIEYLLQRPDGSTFHAEVQGRIWHVEGRAVGMTSIR
ncbi:MAG TPA: MASE1 domain-containing protein, partial [Verrucomicrobiae bacterium]